jgi:hypothetical protein
MADPLSIAASVIGVLSPASRVATVLGKLHDAPTDAYEIRAELVEIRLAVDVLRDLLRRKAASSAAIGTYKQQLPITVEKIALLLESCESTISELDSLLRGLGPGKSMRIGQRYRWVSKEGDIGRLFQRLKSQRSTLILSQIFLNREYSFPRDYEAWKYMLIYSE